MPERAMLQFARNADDGALAVAVDLFDVAAECRDQAVGEQQAEWLQIVHGALQILDIASGEWVLDHGHGRGTPARHFGDRSALVKDLFAQDRDLADWKL